MVSEKNVDEVDISMGLPKVSRGFVLSVPYNECDGEEDDSRVWHISLYFMQ